VSGRQSLAPSGGLPRVLPALYTQIQAVRKRLELEFKDMQDFEFTVQEGKLFLLQTRNGKRTPWAAVQIAADMAVEGIIAKSTALERLRGFDVHTLHRTVLAKPSNVGDPAAMGLPASNGVAVGRVVLDSESASKFHGRGDSTPLILVREAISTEDVVGIAACAGILTKTGGKTSHAAVVARQLGKVCVVGCGDLSIDLRNRKCVLNGKDLHEKDYISLDGSTGAVYEGKVEVVVEEPPMLAMVEAWKAESAAESVTDSPNQ